MTGERPTGMNEEELRTVEELRHQVAYLQRENDRLAAILGLRTFATPQRLESRPSVDSPLESPPFRVDRTASPEAKVEFFRALSVGRDVTYALGWESERTGKHGLSPAVHGGFADALSPTRMYLPLT